MRKVGLFRRHSPFLCPASNPTLLSSATKTHTKKHLYYTRNIFCNTKQHSDHSWALCCFTNALYCLIMEQAYAGNESLHNVVEDGRRHTLREEMKKKLNVRKDWVYRRKREQIKRSEIIKGTQRSGRGSPPVTGLRWAGGSHQGRLAVGHDNRFSLGCCFS